MKNIDYFTYDLFRKIRTEQDLNAYYLIEELNLNGKLLDNCRLLHRMIWKYQPQIQEEINKLKNTIGIKTPYIGFHIRSGDKFKEYELLDPDIYITKAQQHSNIRNAYVLTDNYEVFTSLKSKYPDWNFFTLCKESECGYFHKDFLKKNKEEQKNDLIKLFASMDILESGDYFVRTFSSNPGMNMGFRMDSSKMVGIDYDNWLIW